MKTAAQLIDTFANHYRVLISAEQADVKTLAWYMAALDKLRRPNTEGVIPAELPADQLRLHHLTGIKFNNHFVRSLKTLYRWATDPDDPIILAKNPFRKLRTPPSGERTRILSRSEVSRLYSAASPAFRRYLFVQLHTIGRPGEIRNLKWGDIRFDDCLIVLTKFKGKDRRRDDVKIRTIPLDAVTLRLLKNLRRTSLDPSPKGYVFLGDRKKVVGKQWSYNAVRSAMRRARTRAGLEIEDGERVVCYTLRHTGATTATEAGIADRLLADIMGHATTRTTARYQHLKGGALVDGIERVRKHRSRG